MKARMRMMCGSAIVALVLTSLGGLTWAEDAKKAAPSSEALAAAIAEAAKIGPEHSTLEPLAGSWTYTCKFWMDPSQPPMEMTGTIDRQWILGGRFLEEKITGADADGKPGFEGRGLLGYDNGRKKYTSSFACSMGTGISTGLGKFDASGTELTFETEAYCPLQKKVVNGREVVRIEGSDRVIIESYQKVDGKETKTMEIVSVRKE